MELNSCIGGVLGCLFCHKVADSVETTSTPCDTSLMGLYRSIPVLLRVILGRQCSNWCLRDVCVNEQMGSGKDFIIIFREGRVLAAFQLGAIPSHIVQKIITYISISHGQWCVSGRQEGRAIIFQG